jgi:uncharacterized protein YndB with AHSA1/START domain
MVDVRISGIVRVPPAKAFAYISDFENWPKWQGDMKKTALVKGEAGKVGATYRYVSKAMGQTFDSTLRITRIVPGERVDFEGERAGMITPRGTYLVEPAEGGSRVTLNPHPEMHGVGKLMAFMAGPMIGKLQREHLAALTRELEHA